MEAWKILKSEIEEQIALTSNEPDQDTLDVFKYSIAKLGADIPHDDQIFSTWFYGAPDVTYAMDWIYVLIELANDGESYTMEQLHKLAKYWFVHPSHFGEYCGMFKQYEFTRRIDEMMDTLDREAYIELLSTFRSYIMNVNAWIYQYWPWGVTYAMPRKDRAYYEKGLALLS